MDAAKVKNRDYSKRDHPVQINREGHNDGHFGGNFGRGGPCRLPAPRWLVSWLSHSNALGKWSEEEKK